MTSKQQDQAEQARAQEHKKAAQAEEAQHVAALHARAEKAVQEDALRIEKEHAATAQPYSRQLMLIVALKKKLIDFDNSSDGITPADQATLDSMLESVKELEAEARSPKAPKATPSAESAKPQPIGTWDENQDGIVDNKFG
jgi:outer membrane protein OmpA-like peptidoglycan-associated protein